MSKYSGMSDYEINHKMAELRSGREISKGIDIDIFISEVCENYHDAFTLMIDNGISLLNRNTDYIATKQTLDTKVIQACSKNPCRAIAECFLLMKDRENKNGANNT